MKKRTKQLIALTLAMSMLGGCAGQKQPEDIWADESSADTVERHENEMSSADTREQQDKEVSSETIQEVPEMNLGERPMLIRNVKQSEANDIIPCVEPYTIAEDLSNIDNLWQFYFEGEIQQKLVQNGFVVSGTSGSEFFEIYESNRYMQCPSFVTVDSLMHTYHLYFSYLLKNIEKSTLSETLSTLSQRMLDDSLAQYEQLRGSEWESAAQRNVLFFAVGAKLLDDSVTVPDDVKDMVSTEINKINCADAIEVSAVTGKDEDYTQYKPRGYYEGDETLENYFKAMMWYGRTHFTQESEELDKSALLITKALVDDEEAYRLWESVYAVTSFFAGASDDNGACEYAPVIGEAYSGNISITDLIGNNEAFTKYHEMTSKLRAPQINSIPIQDGDDNVIPGFRFMGQRFTIDAAVMQKLIYSNVKENSQGMNRMLPDVLDVPAALGSDVALDILKENGATDYAGYTENMEQLRTALSQENDTLWNASLYAGWLNTLRPLLTQKGEGYPIFMQSEEWAKKDLECFAGSFAELKHDTILYSKQVMAEMGGGYDEEEPDDRGYVEPEPLVYERFISLSDQTAQGLKAYGMLGADDEENLTRLSQIAEKLLTISKKELQNEELTEEEFEFIRSYGGNIEHFWYDAVSDGNDSEQISSQEYPAAIVADIATDPNGSVLEVATGNPSEIFVVVNVAGKLKIARGSVYSFYQFPWPMDDRLTDSKWRQMMGLQCDEDGFYHYDEAVEKPAWTESYRYE